MKPFRSITSLHSIDFTPEAVWRKTLQSGGYHQPKQSTRQASKRRSSRMRSTLDAEREQLYRTVAAELNAEDWRLMDREDVNEIALPGDEQHTANGQWNCSTTDLLELDNDTAELLIDLDLDEIADQWKELLSMMAEVDPILTTVVQQYFVPIEINPAKITIERSDANFADETTQSSCTAMLRLLSPCVESLLKTVMGEVEDITINPSFSEVTDCLYFYFSGKLAPPVLVRLCDLPAAICMAVQSLWQISISNISSSLLKSLLSQTEIVWICPDIKTTGIRLVPKTDLPLRHILEQKQADINVALSSSPLSVDSIHLSPQSNEPLTAIDDLLWLQSKLKQSARWVTEQFIALNPSYTELRVCAMKLGYNQGWAYHIYRHLQSSSKEK